jgi:hypothetical protein
MGASEKSYRLYSCRRCARQVRICAGCDRGNRYCAQGCAQICRQQTQRRASRRYQQSYRGALKHAARQRAWRRRQPQKVTHQGSLAGVAALIVVSSSILTPTLDSYDKTAGIKPSLPIEMRRTHPHWPLYHAKHTTPRCCFCGGVLAPLARLGPLRSGP